MHQEIKAHQYMVFFVKYRVGSGKIPISYSIIEHIIADLSTKATQWALFLKLREDIMGWKNVDTLQMGYTSTKERFENVDEVNPSKNLKGKNGGKMSYMDIVIGDNNVHKMWSHFSIQQYDMCQVGKCDISTKLVVATNMLCIRY